MRLYECLRNGLSQPQTRRVPRPRRPSRRRSCPRVERCEDRTLLSNFTAASVSDLIADIKAANRAGGTNTITLAASTTFDLTKVNNTTDGPTGLPVIAGNDILTITGQGGDIIQRDSSASPFRLFDVASGATLQLNDLTLQNGFAFGSNVSSQGGAIYNDGSLDLSGVTVQNNVAEGTNGSSGTNSNRNGQWGSSAWGGGVYSLGTELVLENGTLIQNNEVRGGDGGNGYKSGAGGDGGGAVGGGVAVYAGTATFINTTVGANLAQGGSNGTGASLGRNGTGSGGGIAIDGGTVELTSVVVNSNQADPGSGGGLNQGSYGGGIFIDGGTVTLCSDTVQSNTSEFPGGGIAIYGGTVYIDTFTVNNTTNNSPDNIYGSYILQNC
jgi:hypothetical protein